MKKYKLYWPYLFLILLGLLCIVLPAEIGQTVSLYGLIAIIIVLAADNKWHYESWQLDRESRNRYLEMYQEQKAKVDRAESLSVKR